MLRHQDLVHRDAAESDYAKNIQTSVDAKPNVIVTVGFLLAKDTLAASQKNSAVKWIGIDQFQEKYPDNYVGVQFREDQGGFLAGTLAGLLTKSNVVGVVGGRQDVPPVVRFVNAFEKGAEAANAKVKVLKIYNESFTSRPRARATPSSSSARAPTSSSAPVNTGRRGVGGHGPEQVGHRRRPGRVLQHLQQREGGRFRSTSPAPRSSASTSRCSTTSQQP